MSLSASVTAWTVDLPALDKMVLLSLADHADAQGRCWPSVVRLAERCGMHLAPVMRALEALQVVGHITIERGAGRVDRYVLHPKVAQTARLEQPVTHSDRSPRATETEITRTRPEGLEKFLSRFQSTFTEGDRR